MEHFPCFLITWAAALAGGFLARRLKIPAGGMVGAMAATIALSLLTQRANFYEELRVVIQIFSGAMIGSGITRKQLAEMKTIVFPAVVLVVFMALLNLTFGGLMYVLSHLDLATALFASAPGGASDMALIAADLGANPAYVAILQVVRLLIIFSIMPPVFKRIMRNNKWKDKIPCAVAKKEQSGLPKVKLYGKGEWILRFSGLLACAAGGGLLLDYLGVKAGALIGGMVFSGLYSVLTGAVLFPAKGKFLLQGTAGAFIGIRMDRASFFALPELLVPILIMLVGTVTFTFLTSFIMHKLTKLELSTCMFASTPGGLQEMSLLADDLGGDTPKIAILHSVRLTCVIMFFPAMLSIITTAFQ